MAIQIKYSKGQKKSYYGLRLISSLDNSGLK